MRKHEDDYHSGKQERLILHAPAGIPSAIPYYKQLIRVLSMEAVAQISPSPWPSPRGARGFLCYATRVLTEVTTAVVSPKKDRIMAMRYVTMER
jgi:hypothetical protein